MIKKHHTHFVLLILFFTGLIVLWWADVSDVPTGEERQRQTTRVLPGLMKVPVTAIRRLEVTNEHGTFVFERRGGGRWQIRKPVDVAADSGVVARLVTNLQELRRSADAGTVKGAPETFGLNPPAATIRIYGKEPETLLATLEVGKPITLAKGKDAAPDLKDRRYVRTVGDDGKKQGIEVADGRMLAAVDSDLFAWRDKALLSVPTFSIQALTVTGPGRALEARRNDEGHWTLNKPIRVPADDNKVEGTLAELTSLRVVEGKQGFVADDARDLAPYGLDHPALTVTLKSRYEPDLPLVLEVGKPVPDRPDYYYARRGDQDDVVMINGKDLRDLGTDPNELRSKRVADLEPGRVAFVAVHALGRDFLLARTATGWALLQPSRGKADAPSVQNLLAKLADLQAADFLESSKVTDPRLDPPAMTLKVWAFVPRERPPAEPPSAPQGEPVVSLQLGRHDALRKTVFGRVEGDKTILALPDQFLDVLPKNELAYRDRTILTLSPAAITRLTVRRDARTYELSAPGATGDPNQWKMHQPVESPADPESVTRLLMLLSNLTAETLVTDRPGDGKTFGLDQPAIAVTWTSEPGGETGTLRVGANVPKSEEVYATIEGQPLVFTLSPGAVQVLRSEFHSRKVLSFPADQVSRLVLRWPERTLAFLPKSGRGAPGIWRPEPGTDISGFDLSRIPSLVQSLANLRTEQFVQYRGIFPSTFGLDHPRLTIQVRLSGTGGTKELRVGDRSPDGPLYATTEAGSAGAVFLLSGPAWADLAKAQQPRLPDLPENVFAPAPGKAVP